MLWLVNQGLSNRKEEVLFFMDGGKPEKGGKKERNQRRERTTILAHK